MSSGQTLVLDQESFGLTWHWFPGLSIPVTNVHRLFSFAGNDRRGERSLQDGHFNIRRNCDERMNTTCDGEITIGRSSEQPTR
ncbi:hypothetical protein TNCV_3237391 [Trichonephila clavipes]|nr:hypothetical protein TNCV_3237391 [Trichonephila clavipes]